MIDMVPPFPGPVGNIGTPEEGKCTRNTCRTVQDKLFFGSKIGMVVQKPALVMIIIIHEIGFVIHEIESRIDGMIAFAAAVFYY